MSFATPDFVPLVPTLTACGSLSEWMLGLRVSGAGEIAGVTTRSDAEQVLVDLCSQVIESIQESGPCLEVN